MKVRGVPEPVFLSVALVVSCWVRGLLEMQSPRLCLRMGGAVGVAQESALSWLSGDSDAPPKPDSALCVPVQEEPRETVCRKEL